MYRKLLTCALAFAALCAPLSRQIYAAPDAPFALVKDIETTPYPISGMSHMPLFATVGDTILFSAHTPQTGTELWRTDGSEAGTSLVKDINAGEESSNYGADSPSVVLNGALLFAANDGALGHELWRSDGTPTGTILLKDTWPGVEGGEPRDFHVTGDRAFFTTEISDTAYALWVTDGTAAGTKLLKTYSDMNHFTVYGKALLFSAAESGDDRELWRSDGTPAGTTLVKDIVPGPQGSYPKDLIVISLEKGVLFSAYDEIYGRELWATDGTPGNTFPVIDIAPNGGSSEPRDIRLLPGGVTASNPDRFLFNADDGVHGRELWVTDGYIAGTQLVKDVRPNNVGAEPSPRGTMPGRNLLRSRAFYAMNDGVHGYELWVTDGTPANTIMLADIAPNAAWSEPDNVTVVSGLGFFAAGNAATGCELWRTDGTPAGTLQMADIYSGTQSSDPTSLTAFKGKLYFTANDAVRGYELWRSDGTPQGTTLFKDIGPGKGGGARHVLGVALGGLYFSADDGATGYELWRTDGTAEGTVIVKNIAPDVGGIYVYPEYNAAALGDRLVMGLRSGPIDLAQTAMTEATTDSDSSNRPGDSSPADTVLDGRSTLGADQLPAATNAMWVSDGTGQGTAAIRSLPSVNGSDLFGFTPLGNGVLFGGADNLRVTELWRTDSTPGGTGILGNAVKPYFGYVRHLTKLNDQVVFGVLTDTTSNLTNPTYSVWKTDGTPQGTQQVKANVVFGRYDEAASGNTVFFSGRTNELKDSNNYELWKTDGTEAGTIQVKDIVSGTNGSYPKQITPGAPGGTSPSGGSVFFIAKAGTQGYQLWKSDGTEPGTSMVRDVRPSDDKDEFDELAFVNGTLFFSADDGVNGWELWKSDGTPQGTALVADLYPGYGSSGPESLIGLNGVLYFSATGSDGRRTLWRSDGSPAGTQPVRNDAAAPLNPYNLAVVSGQLMFSAFDDARGREPWQSDGTPGATMLMQDITPGADSSNPQGFIETGKHTWFTAEAHGAGRELWARPLAGGPAPAGYKTYLPVVTR